MNKKNIIISKLFVKLSINIARLRQISKLSTKNADFSKICGVGCTNLAFFKRLSVRSNRPEVLCKKSVLRNFAKFTGKYLCQRLFFNKVAGLGGVPEMFHKKAVLKNFAIVTGNTSLGVSF